MEKHCDEVHGTNIAYPCLKSNCKYVAVTSASLKMHAKFHDEGRMKKSQGHFCHLCPNTFQGKCELNRHLDVHENRMKQCPFCKYRYPEGEPVKLEQHLNTHFHMKPYQCPNCDKQFSAPESFG